MFGNLRLFSIASVLVVLMIAVAGALYLRQLSHHNLMQRAYTNNARLSRGYISTVWKQYREALVPYANDPGRLKGDPRVMQFAQETLRYFQPMPVVQANIYDSNGMLLLTIKADSSVSSLGNAVIPSPASILNGVIKTGHPVNTPIDNVPLNGHPSTLMQTIVPIHTDGADAPDGSPSEGAVEVLSNITLPWDDINHLQWFSIAEIIIGFVVLFTIMTLTTQKTETIIARQHEANLELAAAAAAAQAENREKSQFLANVSHELRTPLNAIIGFSDIIKTEVMGTVTDKKYHDYINDIHSSGVHLLSLINDILDYSKAEAGKLDLEISEINANKMIQNCIRLVAPRAESGQVKLIENLPKEQLTMLSDSKKFKQILLNLLSNAVKFTPPGGEVRVTAWSNITDDSFSFEVQDSGIGIAPKDISRAMALFGQVDNTLKRKYEGTGLGLPLTKKFVELMGGKFTIESEVNVGTKIIFTLPREITPREGIIIKQA